MELDALLGALRSEAPSLSRVAAANLTRDLAAVLQRLRRGEYEKTDFLTRNVFDLPRRTREFFAYLEDWDRQAREWVEVLRPLPLTRFGRVANLCPGWSPKLELALGHLGFGGTVVLVDRSAEAVQRIQEFARLFRTELPLEHLRRDLWQPAPETFPLVVASHVLDDLTLDAFRERLGLASWEALYEQEEAVRGAWEALVAARDAVLREMPARIATALTQYVGPGGYLAFSHYPSLAEQLLRHEPSAALFRELFAATRQAVLDSGFAPLPLSGAGYDPAQFVLAQRC